MLKCVAEFAGKVNESLQANHLAVFGHDYFFGGLSLASSVDVVKTTQGAKTPNELAGFRHFFQLQRLSFAFPAFIDITIFGAGINGALRLAFGACCAQEEGRVGSF